jgi:replicative DNA helicase
MSIYTQKLKWIARKFHKPIIAVSHLKKINNPNTIAQLDDLKGSSSIGQDSDIVLMVWRDIKNKFMKDANGRGMLVTVRKNRRRGTLGATLFKLSDYGYPLQTDYQYNDEDDF